MYKFCSNSGASQYQKIGNSSMLLLTFVLAFALLEPSDGTARMTKVTCELFNSSVLAIEECSLTELDDKQSSVNLRLNVLQALEKNIMVSYSLWRDIDGYKPFFRDLTVDFCCYMENPSRFPYFEIIHNVIVPHSNWNHTCPYEDTMVLKDFVVSDKMFKAIPMPRGNYMFYLKIASGSVPVIDLRFYVYLDMRKSLRKSTSG